MLRRPEEDSNTWSIITNKTLTAVEDHPEITNTYNSYPGDCRMCSTILKNLSLIVQQINMLIEMRYPSVASTYNKL
jgi:hypothetical protein